MIHPPSSSSLVTDVGIVNNSIVFVKELSKVSDIEAIRKQEVVRVKIPVMRIILQATELLAAAQERRPVSPNCGGIRPVLLAVDAAAYCKGLKVGHFRSRLLFH